MGGTEKVRGLRPPVDVRDPPRVVGPGDGQSAAPGRQGGDACPETPRILGGVAPDGVAHVPPGQDGALGRRVAPVLRVVVRDVQGQTVTEGRVHTRDTHGVHSWTSPDR